MNSRAPWLKHCGAVMVLSLVVAVPQRLASAETAAQPPQMADSGAFRHLRALQDIATANGGNRAAGTSGYDRSADYVADQLKEAGYRVRFEPFEFDFFEERSPVVLAT